MLGTTSTERQLRFLSWPVQASSETNYVAIPSGHVSLPSNLILLYYGLRRRRRNYAIIDSLHPTRRPSLHQPFHFLVNITQHGFINAGNNNFAPYQNTPSKKYESLLVAWFRASCMDGYNLGAPPRETSPPSSEMHVSSWTLITWYALTIITTLVLNKILSFRKWHSSLPGTIHYLVYVT